MRLARLELGVDPVEFDHDRAVAEAEAQLAEPRRDEAADRSWLEVADDHLAAEGGGGGGGADF